ncbi:MAG TPA: FadR/GntR family transcriptional regulator [Nocardioides sp.]|uniref:FadR/GntR family transcriptional regulator n=1 Tax=Nocardioides sp. TaxID=35761 RepID=UPI002ED85911
MPIAGVTPHLLVDQAIDAMRGLLGSGEWSVGTRIPPEPVLAEQFGVSRNTVREAVRALSHSGVLEVRRGDGTYVVSANEVAGVMRRHLARADLGHVFEVRHAIETSAAELAAERRTKQDLARLAQALTARSTALAAGDAEAFVTADVEFHVGVVTAARNPLLSELYDGFVATLRDSIELPSGEAAGSCADHDRLYDALAAQDGAAAREATGGLLRRSEDEASGA